MSKVYFIGAGPGDVELITVKGKRLLEAADVVIYAGSLVNPELVLNIKAQVYDSASMVLEEIMTLMEAAIKDNKTVIRLHTGDTAFYSAISEQIEVLRERGIDYEVVPGVSSAQACAAVLGQEFTIPEVSQTIIFTRLEGKTPVPERESLRELSQHGATMAIFLSVGMVERVRAELLEGYKEETPVAVIERVTWPNERVIRCRLGDLVEAVQSAGIQKTAIILVGEALWASLQNTDRKSKLYSKDFSHGYRK
ncbi:MAG: precorrin-4 C(11)-methyltransferase [Candidatus Magnetoovum sp. WYHC-5]|nr:precorrin-4 C(11)-methyltransferase [Candidatus Magnetoovum sp. WYHC-5]